MLPKPANHMARHACIQHSNRPTTQWSRTPSLVISYGTIFTNATSLSTFSISQKTCITTTECSANSRWLESMRGAHSQRVCLRLK
eukprot:617024-Pelagomonas_calceolata.AAC.1